MRIRHPAADEGKKIVVVVGSGFAGLNAAKALSQSKEVAVFLIDQRNYHLFQPPRLDEIKQSCKLAGSKRLGILLGLRGSSFMFSI